MEKKYKSILDVVRVDIERVNKNLDFDVESHVFLSDELKPFVLSPSKRIRSLVTILYLRALKLYLLPSHYELLAAVELIHNASLIHDDVIDEASLRRHKRTINDKFGNQLAVVSGDFLIGVALKKFVKIASLEIMEIFADTLQRMCLGEINQYFNRYKKNNIDSYIEKTSQKTASLFVSALRSAILLAEGEFDEKSKEFAETFGIAFQIRDDLLNVLGRDKSKQSSDVDKGIYNAAIMLSADKAEGIKETRLLLNNYVNCAMHCISDLEDSVYKKALIELLELIKNV